MKYGYARVSTDDQNADIQHDPVTMTANRNLT
jgi:DNA invertase Pin-like site-specific DNA recombinase